MKETLNKFKMRLPALLLLVASLLFWGFYDRYEAVAPPLLDDLSLADAQSSRGEVTETNGIYILNVPEGGGSASVRFLIPDLADYSTLRAIGRIRTDSVVEGKYGWRCARIVLTQYDSNNKWLPGHHSVVASRDTCDWDWTSNEFDILPNATYAKLIIEQSGLSGRADFSDLQVFPVQIKKSFPVFRVLFTILWLILAKLYFNRCRLNSRKLKVLIAMNTTVILIGTLLPSSFIQDGSHLVKDVVTKAMSDKASAAPAVSAGQPAVEAKKPPQKISGNRAQDTFLRVIGPAHRWGHFALFASLCFLVYLSAALERQHPVYYLKVAFDLLLFSAITEALQYLTLDRTPGISDWKTDLYGMLTAFIIFLIFQLVSKVWKERKKRFGV